MDSLSSRPVAATGLVAILTTTALLIRTLNPPRTSFAPPPQVIPSPRTTLLPVLSPSQTLALPYPPTTALPGARTIPTLHGSTTQAFSFGPPTGERVLLLAGISTPCIGLATLALSLVERGYRVCLFDYFGRGWSDAPDPAVVDHDESVYVNQILAVLAGVGWLGESVHVVGYSFGGGLAVALAGYFPACVRSVTLIAPGGLARRDKNAWRTRLVYSRGWFPEAVLGWFVKRRFAPRTGSWDREVRAEAVGNGGDAFEDALVSPTTLPGVTVGHVMRWQVDNCVGFVPAVVSAFRYGPIYERYEEWGRLAEMLTERRKDHSLSGLLGGKVLLVLGRTDAIVQEDIAPEAKRVLGDDGVETVILDAGHELAMTKGVEIADACVAFWEANCPGSDKK